MDDIIKSPPPPHARLLQRRASTIGINMDRVSREKQHLEEEVASLRKYLNRSATRRRFSTVEAPKAPPLGAMKTLESLLQKSDIELKEANAKISRLQSVNADTEERMKDFEMMQDDLRRAVVIANNYAAEEREKCNALEEERDDLTQRLEVLKRENSRLRKSRAINAVYRKGTRSVKSLTASEEDLADSDGADVESDISSLSRKSSNASDI
jgi:vacuolar-type H+-ATPase subunit I/STV1